MDERQRKIVTGAGLEESRVNQEFLDFLNKWSFPVLLVVALVSLGYFAWNSVVRGRIEKRDEAFGQLAAVEGTGSPSVFSLTEIASEFEGVGSVAEVARLGAADMHMQAVRTGIDPGDGETELTEEDRVYRLEQAESLYRRVLESSSGVDGHGLIAANAAFGLAAVAETRGETEAARDWYTEAESMAEKAGYAPLARVAEEMKSGIGEVDETRLYSREDLPRMPYMPDPEERSGVGEGAPVLPGAAEPAGPLPPDAVGPAGDGDGSGASGDGGSDSSGDGSPAEDVPTEEPTEEPADGTAG